MKEQKQKLIITKLQEKDSYDRERQMKQEAEQEKRLRDKMMIEKHIQNVKESDRMKREMKKRQQKKYLETIAQQAAEKKVQYIAWNY